MKTTTPLSEDQRWLLWTVGLTITRPLLSNEGLERFMQSRNGSYGRPREGAPEWLRGHQVRGGAVVSLPESAVGVKVTAAQIRAFRKTIPTEPLTELATIDSAEMDEHWRTELVAIDCEPRPHHFEVDANGAMTAWLDCYETVRGKQKLLGTVAEVAA